MIPIVNMIPTEGVTLPEMTQALDVSLLSEDATVEGGFLEALINVPVSVPENLSPETSVDAQVFSNVPSEAVEITDAARIAPIQQNQSEETPYFASAQIDSKTHPLAEATPRDIPIHTVVQMKAEPALVKPNQVSAPVIPNPPKAVMQNNQPIEAQVMGNLTKEPTILEGAKLSSDRPIHKVTKSVNPTVPPKEMAYAAPLKPVSQQQSAGEPQVTSLVYTEHAEAVPKDSTVIKPVAKPVPEILVPLQAAPIRKEQTLKVAPEQISVKSFEGETAEPPRKLEGFEKPLNDIKVPVQTASTPAFEPAVSKFVSLDPIVVPLEIESISAPKSVELRSADLPVQTSRFNTPQFVTQQIADVARALPDGPVEINLSPKELGKVSLSLSMAENGSMTVVIGVERSETLDLLRRNVEGLMSEFTDLGYESSQFQFTHFHPPEDAETDEEPIDRPYVPTPLASLTLHAGRSGLDLKL